MNPNIIAGIISRLFFKRYTMEKTGCNCKYTQDLINFMGYEEIQQSLDDTIADVILTADIDKMVKDQIMVIISIKRMIRKNQENKE